MGESLVRQIENWSMKIENLGEAKFGMQSAKCKMQSAE